MVEVNKHLPQVAYHHWHHQCPTRRDRTSVHIITAEKEILGQWRSKGGVGWQVGHAPWGAGLGGASARFLHSFKN